MTIPRFSPEDTVRYFELPPHSQLATISQVLSLLVSEGKVKINVIAALSTETRDYIIHGYTRAHDDNLLMSGIYKMVVASLLAGASVAILRGPWWLAFIAGVVAWFLVGYYFSKRNTLLAIKKTVVSDSTFFDGLWDRHVVSLTLSDRNGGVSSTSSIHWKSWIEMIALDEETISHFRPPSN